MKTISLIRLIFPLIILCHSTLYAQETELTDYPQEWPSDIPKISDLTNISGFLNVSDKRINIDLSGKVTSTDDDTFTSYVQKLEEAGFETLNVSKEFDMNRGQFEKGAYYVTVGSNIVHARTNREYHEIGITIVISK